MVVFVTGKSGSGKSSFAKRLADILNYEYVDVDKIGHSIYNDSNVLDAVVNIFSNNKALDIIFFSLPSLVPSFFTNICGTSSVF